MRRRARSGADGRAGEGELERLKGKAAVVTGGCSGIGLATVELFVAEGARVLLADVQDERGAEIAGRFAGAVEYRRCDVTSERDIERAMAAAADAFGGLDIVFNNAGAGGARERIDEIGGDAWDRTQALLLRSVALGIRYAVPLLRARGGGAIVNTASVAGLQAGWGPIAYSVAKAGVIHLTRTAAAELARDRIRVNAICPGYILTGIFTASSGISGNAAGQVDAALAELAPKVQPIADSGSPRHIAEACLYLASDAAAFVTGEHLVVDGGLTIGPRSAWDPETVSPIRAIIQNARRAE